jgi:hypothetical protein
VSAAATDDARERHNQAFAVDAVGHPGVGQPRSGNRRWQSKRLRPGRLHAMHERNAGKLVTVVIEDNEVSTMS